MCAQIRFEERVRIEELLGEGYLQAEVARALRRDPGSISRELRRNEIGGQYSAKMAQALAHRRRSERPLVRKMDRPEIREPVIHGLSQQWSPDEICGRQQEQFAKQPQRHVSASTIYRWIEQPGPLKSHWKRQLRRRGRARWVPRKPAKRPGQPLRDRPRIIEKRGRLGDFEGDLVLGSPGRGGVFTMVCRKSRYLRAAKVRNKNARHQVILRRAGLSAPAWYERKHQRPTSTILPQRDRLHNCHPTRTAACRKPDEQSPAPLSRLPNPSRSLPRTICDLKLQLR